MPSQEYDLRLPEPTFNYESELASKYEQAPYPTPKGQGLYLKLILRWDADGRLTKKLQLQKKDQF